MMPTTRRTSAFITARASWAERGVVPGLRGTRARRGPGASQEIANAAGRRVALAAQRASLSSAVEMRGVGRKRDPAVDLTAVMSLLNSTSVMRVYEHFCSNGSWLLRDEDACNLALAATPKLQVCNAISDVLEDGSQDEWAPVSVSELRREAAARLSAGVLLGVRDEHRGDACASLSRTSMAVACAYARREFR